MTNVTDASEFILKVEKELNRLKETKNRYHYDFDLIFSERSIGENVKSYFEGKGYKVELKWCTGCQVYKSDLIIEIQ